MPISARHAIVFISPKSVLLRNVLFHCVSVFHMDTSVVVTTPFSQFPSRSSFSIRPGNPNLEFPANLSLSKRNRRMEGYETLNSKIAEEDRERERENRNALVGRVVDDYGARPA